MRQRDLLALAAGTVAGAAGVRALLHGMLHGADDLRLERATLPLRDWPESLRGFRVAVLTDLHLSGQWSFRRAERAVAMTLAERPDAVALVGDYVDTWTLDGPRLVGEALAPLRAMRGAVVAVPGNHDYNGGDPDLLRPIFDEIGIRLLRNESWTHRGVTWVGVDSAIEGRDRPRQAMRGVEGPALALLHEPDVVDRLPAGCALVLSGHTHGGQGRLFGRFKPKKTELGARYVDGFFPDAPTPLYVSRGVGTTLFPLRLDVPPEVSLLTLVPT